MNCQSNVGAWSVPSAIDLAASRSADAVVLYKRTMHRDEVIARIRKHADAIRAEGATALYLFGSAARNQVQAESDIDIFVDYNPESRFSLLNMSGIRLIVMDELRREVDITTRDSLHPRFKSRILSEAVRVL